MEIDYKAIGCRIREKRIEKNMTQDSLASQIGVSNPHISNIERGRTKVSLPTLLDIANSLDTTLDELICDNLQRGKVIFDKEISSEIKKCNETETKIVYDIVKALIKSLQERKY